MAAADIPPSHEDAEKFVAQWKRTRHVVWNGIFPKWRYMSNNLWMRSQPEARALQTYFKPMSSTAAPPSVTASQCCSLTPQQWHIGISLVAGVVSVTTLIVLALMVKFEPKAVNATAPVLNALANATA